MDQYLWVNFVMQMPRLGSAHCSYKPSLAAERRSLGGWQEQTLTSTSGKAGADLGRKVGVEGLLTLMANWCYCVQVNQVRVRTFLEVETVGSGNLDPKAVVLYQSPSQRVFLPSPAVASTHWAYKAAALDSLRQHRSRHL